MSNANSLFNFGRSLPEPFETVTKKKLPISSKYGDGMQSTLCATVIKAVNMLCKLNNLAEKGAVGIIDSRCVCEYKSANSEDEYHLVVYDKASGTTLASIYYRN